jgi:hypothetical protein
MVLPAPKKRSFRKVFKPARSRRGLVYKPHKLKASVVDSIRIIKSHERQRAQDARRRRRLDARSKPPVWPQC